ncbi:uncharacterized protein MJAP1_002644 [Malassezia japonica]|uniref:Uncharacterized protein n=1 Tax=Malassezia japonica TaxID=223818 RepID=A0AAF0F4E8_9BASI|nr:uncharacterized protein MJAP1_002644 [Malassezia japonica]WFD39664.1 hypothetical protein MJAP1_002644 [Malassezia japonica]
MRDEYSAFLTWLREQGAQFPDGVYFADDDVTGPGLFSKDDIPSDQCIMAIPHTLIMHPATSKARITAALGYEDEQKTLVMRDWILLDLVLHRLLDGKKSHVAGDLLQHAPYVRILPAAFGTPLECKPSEITLLDGTSLFNGTMHRLQKTSDAAERSKAWLAAACAVPRLASDPAAVILRTALASDWLSLWRWADDVYGSRSFPASFAGWAVPPASHEPVLIPGIDSINHMRAYPVTWEYEEVDDTMPWMLEDESDGVREPILERVREYRQVLLRKGVQWTQSKLDQILDELEALGYTL